jgi:hypothetical protein
MSGTITYNVFRHGGDPAILCVVPNDKPVPAFIAGSAWCFERAIPAGEVLTDGFRPTLAKAAANLNGFYVFLSFRRAFHDPWIAAPSPQEFEPLAA